MRDLKKDESITIVPADKGKCLVIMDRCEYINKMEEKLKEVTTYKRLERDPTHQIKEKLSSKLKEIHENGEINYALYRKLLPTRTQIPRM